MNMSAIQQHLLFNMEKVQSKSSSRFEILGYQKTYYINKKLVGQIKLNEPDREKFGYYGKKTEILNEDMYFSNSKKTIKKGTEVVTELDILYGKCKIKFFGLKNENNQNI